MDTKFKKGLIPWNKGKYLSEEEKEKISEATKKAMSRPEIMKKISKTFFKKGQASWNKGRHMSKESVKKQNESWMRTFLSNPEVREKMSESHKGQIAWNKGIRMSEKARKKMSEVRKGKTPWNKGKHLSEETKMKLSKFYTGRPKPWMKGKPSWMKGKHQSEKWRMNIGMGNLGKRRTEEFKRKMSEFKKGKKYPGTTARRRELILERYASGIYPPQLNTKPERQIKAELVRRGYKEGIDFIHQYKFMNKFMCDFCFPQYKIIVEVYGDYWHSNPQIYTSPTTSHQIKGMKRDKSKEAYITKVDNRAWTYLVLWENDIKQDVTKCVDKIEEILKNKRSNI